MDIKVKLDGVDQENEMDSYAIASKDVYHILDYLRDNTENSAHGAVLLGAALAQLTITYMSTNVTDAEYNINEIARIAKAMASALMIAKAKKDAEQKPETIPEGHVLN